MASGYTGCIDTDRIKGTIGLLSSLIGCLQSRGLPGEFIDIEKIIKDINFNHNNCIVDYKDSIDEILERITRVEKQIIELEESLSKTVTSYGRVDTLKKEEIEEIGKQYSDNKPISVSEEIKVAKNIVDYKQSLIHQIQEEYEQKYGVPEEEALRLATLKNQYETSSKEYSKIVALKQRLTSIGDSIVKELQSDYTNPDNTVVIPPPTVEESSNEINTVPIGIAIGAAGIAGSIGAVIASEHKSKKNFSLESYKEPEDLDQEVFVDRPYEVESSDLSDTLPYRAERDKEVLNKFYNDSYMFEDEDKDR